MLYIMFKLAVLGATLVVVGAPPTECPAPGLFEPIYYLAPDRGWMRLKSQFMKDLNESPELEAYLKEKADILKTAAKDEQAEARSQTGCLLSSPLCESQKEVINHLKVMNTEEEEECWQVEPLSWFTCVPSKGGSTYPDLSCVEPSTEVGFRCLVDYVWRDVFVYCVSEQSARFATMPVKVAYACKTMIYKCQTR